MSQQYYDNSGQYNGNDYAELSGYYNANRVPENSLLTFNIYPQDAKYFDLNRKTNRHVKNFKPMTYDILTGRGQYTPYSSYREGYRNVSPQVEVAGGAVINNKYATAERDDSELLFLAYANPR
jgi:hypothetical protein